MAGLVLAAMLLVSTDQPPPSEQRQPLPPGNRIVAADGDTIVVEHDTRVRIVRSTEAKVRAIFNAEEGWLIVLADHAVDGALDGRVDSTRTYHGVAGQWPLDTGWEGSATLEEFVLVGPGTMGPPGFGLRTAHGVVQFLGF